MSDAKPIPGTLSDRPRIIGYDVARSLAILAMIVVHFSLEMATDRENPAWLDAILAEFGPRRDSTTPRVCGLVFFLLIVIASWLWKRHFQYGPLEQLMRVVAGNQLYSSQRSKNS
ncbi:MAG: Membrane protein [Planctomycetaceae bacterium]|nr:Membrane protein [Planctomycetaceae bacterium]